jgi:hypothetical protein
VSLPKPIESYETVVAWAEGLRRQWGGDPFAEEPAKLQSMEAFCQFIDKDPDQLVAFCFLRRKATGERFGSKQRREEVLQKLKEFEAVSGWRGIEARRRRSHVTSFLSHNGLLI